MLSVLNYEENKGHAMFCLALRSGFISKTTEMMRMRDGVGVLKRICILKINIKI